MHYKSLFFIAITSTTSCMAMYKQPRGYNGFKKERYFWDEARSELCYKVWSGKVEQKKLERVDKQEQLIRGRHDCWKQRGNLLEKQLDALKRQEKEAGSDLHPENSQPPLYTLLTFLNLKEQEKRKVIEEIRLQPKKDINILHEELEKWSPDQNNIPSLVSSIVGRLKAIKVNSHPPINTRKQTIENNNGFKTKPEKKTCVFTKIDLRFLPLL